MTKANVGFNSGVINQHSQKAAARIRNRTWHCSTCLFDPYELFVNNSVSKICRSLDYSTFLKKVIFNLDKLFAMVLYNWYKILSQNIRTPNQTQNASKQKLNELSLNTCVGPPQTLLWYGERYTNSFGCCCKYTLCSVTRLLRPRTMSSTAIFARSRRDMLPPAVDLPLVPNSDKGLCMEGDVSMMKTTIML